MSTVDEAVVLAAAGVGGEELWVGTLQKVVHELPARVLLAAPHIGAVYVQTTALGTGYTGCGVFLANLRSVV